MDYKVMLDEHLNELEKREFLDNKNIALKFKNRLVNAQGEYAEDQLIKVYDIGIKEEI